MYLFRVFSTGCINMSKNKTNVPIIFTCSQHFPGYKLVLDYLSISEINSNRLRIAVTSVTSSSSILGR